jgi:hypothetical protein
MPHFWLTYGDASRLVGVVVMEAPSMLQARMKAAVPGIDAGAPFAEGHALSAKLTASVSPTQIGRMLSRGDAAKLLARFEGRNPVRPPRKPNRRH